MVSNNEKVKKYHLQHQALVDKIKEAGIYARLPRGFVKCGFAGNVELLTDNCFISVITGVKAAYYCPDISDGTDVSGYIYDLFAEITGQYVGVGFLTPTGYSWLVFDTDQYREVCKRVGIEEDEFRVYPLK